MEVIKGNEGELKLMLSIPTASHDDGHPDFVLATFDKELAESIANIIRIGQNSKFTWFSMPSSFSWLTTEDGAEFENVNDTLYNEELTLYTDRGFMLRAESYIAEDNTSMLSEPFSAALVVASFYYPDALVIHGEATVGKNTIPASLNVLTGRVTFAEDMATIISSTISFFGEDKKVFVEDVKTEYLGGSEYRIKYNDTFSARIEVGKEITAMILAGDDNEE